MELVNALNITTRQQLREWYLANSTLCKEMWIRCTRKKESSDAVYYLDAVEEALCFGWIDSTQKKDSDGNTWQRFTPRRKNSNWTELNKERCRRLIKLGLMTEHGEKALPPLDEDSFVIEDWVLEALKSDKQTWHNFCQQPPLYQRVRIYNIQFSKHRGQEIEAQTKLAKYIEATRAGKLIGQWHDNSRLLDH